MSNHARIAAALAGSALCLLSNIAPAHVSVAGPGFAGKNQILRFSVGHGCEGADTVKVQVDIPKEVTTVRALPSFLGDAELEKDAAGAVTSVTWTKSTTRASDDAYYEFAIRIGVPNAPFTTLYFPATQTCRTAEGVESTVDWKATAEEIAAVKDAAAAPEPAPSLVILPPRSPGWNKYKVPSAITDLSVFDDAAIVWVGDAAYSSNPATKELIGGEKDVTELKEIPEGSEIWVKY